MNKQQPFSLKKRLKSFIYALSGIKEVAIKEHNVRIHFVAILVVCILGYYLGIAQYQWMALILAMALVVVTEFLNSAIERIADYVEPSENSQIGVIKDIAAGAVLVASIAAAIIGLMVFIPEVSEMIG